MSNKGMVILGGRRGLFGGIKEEILKQVQHDEKERGILNRLQGDAGFRLLSKRERIRGWG